MLNKRVLSIIILVCVVAFAWFVNVRPVSAASPAECASIGKCESAGACWDSATGADGCRYSCCGGNWCNPQCGSSQDQAAAAAAAAANKAEYDRRVAEQQAAAAAAAQAAAQRAAAAAAANAAAKAAAEQAAAAAAAQKAAAEQAAAAAAAQKAAAEQKIRDMGQALPTYSGGQTYDPKTGQASTSTTTTPGASDSGLGTAGSVGAVCQAAGKTEPFCGGWEGLFRCVPISIGTECNMRCGLSVDATCAARAGQSDLAGTHQTQLNGAMVVYKPPPTATKCSKPICDAETQLQFACQDPTSGVVTNESGHICVDREQYRQAELSGGTTVDSGNKENQDAIILNLSSLFMYDGTNPSGTHEPAFGGFENDDQKKQCEAWAKSMNILSPTDFCSRSFVNGTGVFTSDTDVAGRTIDGQEGTACTPGVFQSTILFNGSINVTQRGGDRSSCGTASGCAAGQQRVCNTNGKLSACGRTDACAWQVQPAGVEQGASCANLRLLSYGESTKGIFVGCSNGKNCFCQSLSSSSKVQCYLDAGADSCGASGGQTVIESKILTVAGDETNLPASPNPTPTTTVTLQCTGLAQSVAAPKIGDQVSFTCSASMENLVTRYEFRYGVSTTAAPMTAAQMQTLAAVQGQPHVSQPITVDTVGRYFAQCRPCTANSCLDWEDATQITTGGAE